MRPLKYENLFFSREHALNIIFLDIRYDKFRYNPIIWKKQFNELDFISYIGGLLGLLAGISVLSIGEVIYWITTRLFRCRISESSTRVVPLDEGLNNNENRIAKVKVYVLKYLEESSIHGLRYLLDGKVLQRLVEFFWSKGHSQETFIPVFYVPEFYGH